MVVVCVVYCDCYVFVVGCCDFFVLFVEYVELLVEVVVVICVWWMIVWFD